MNGRPLNLEVDERLRTNELHLDVHLRHFLEKEPFFVVELPRRPSPKGVNDVLRRSHLVKAVRRFGVPKIVQILKARALRRIVGSDDFPNFVSDVKLPQRDDAFVFLGSEEPQH